MATETVKIVLTLDDSQLSQVTQRVGSQLRQVQTAVNDTAKSTKKIDHHFNGLVGRFRDLIIVGGLVRFALRDIADVFNLTVGGVIRASAEIERMTVLMKGLSTATSEQGKELDAIQGREFVFNMAKTAPFEVKALTDSFVKLKSAGLDPMDGTLKTLVDSVSRFGGNSETLKRASVAIQQMAGKGVISMEELRQQLGEAVPSAMRSMAIGTGLSMGQLVKHISNGEVESTQALKRMFTVMKFENEGAAEALNKTWLGQFERLKTNITLFQNQIGGGNEGFFAILKDNLAQLNSYFESSEAKRFAADIGQALAQTAVGVIEATKFIIKYGDEIVKVGKALALIWAGKTIFAGISSAVGAIKSMSAAYASNLASLKNIETERVAINRNEIMRENLKNNEILRNQIATNNGKIAALKIQQDAEMTLMLAHNKRALAAQLSLERGVTTRGTPVNVGRATSTMENQRALAQSAQANARSFAVAQAQMATANATHMASITANSTRAGAALAAIGTTARASAVAMGVLRTTFNALGGWIGLVSIALTVGISWWMKWGDAAKENAAKARDAIRAAKEGYASLEDAKLIQASINSDKEKELKLTQDIARLEKEQRFAKIIRAPKRSVADLQTDIDAKKKDLEQTQKAIKDNTEQQIRAEDQGNKELRDTYVRHSQDKMRTAIEALTTEHKSKLEQDKLAISQSGKSEAEKAQAITKIEAAAIKYVAETKIASYAKQNQKLRQDLLNNEAAENKLSKEAVNAKLALIMENEKIIQDAVADKSNASTITTPMNLLGGDPDGSSASKRVNTKLQDLIDGVASKNAQLKVETEGMRGTLAKFEEDLARNKFDQEVMIGKKKVTVKPSQAQIAEARKVLAEQDRLKDIEDNNAYIARMADEAGKAFDYLETAMIDGNARYAAALSNYDSNGRGDNAQTERMVANFAKQREAIVRYHEATAQSAEASAAALKVFDDAVAGAVGNARAAKALEMAQDWKRRAEEINLSLIEDTVARANAEKDNALKILKDQYDQQIKLLEDNEAEKLKITEEYGKLKEAMERDFARRAETPMQQTARQWRDATTQMRNASVGWANQTMDKITELAKTGKADFGELVDSILTDILRITLQKQLSGALDAVFTGIEDVVGGAINNSGGNKDGTEGVGLFDIAVKGAGRALDALTGLFKGTSDASKSATDGLASTAVESITQATQSATASNALGFVANSALAAANALNQLAVSGGGAAASSGGGGFFGDLLGSVGGFFGDLFGGSNASPGIDFGSAGTGGPGIDFGSASNGFFSFANGGIMSQFGAVNLRKYANGGIANTPQLALFGEGSMNEAYVPLPDGRTIPVTMTGGNGGSNVVVNVIGAPAGTETRETKTQDGGLQIDVIIAQVEGKISQNLSKGRGTLAGTMEKTYGLNRAAGAY